MAQGGASNGAAGPSGASGAGAAAAGSSNGGTTPGGSSNGGFPASGSSAASPPGGASNGGNALGGSPGGAGSAGTVSGGSAGSAGMDGSGPTGATFRVSGRQLYDRCGEEVVLRGVSEMIVWSDGKDGAPEFAEIAKTGANVVRIVWTDEGSAAELDRAIENALAQKLIPMPEHHGATGGSGITSAGSLGHGARSRTPTARDKAHST